MSVKDRIRIVETRLLSDDWYVLKKVTFDYLRGDGVWQRQSRETYDRGNAAVILLYDLARRSLVLTRQFRLPAFVNGYDELLIEVPAGLLDGASPEDRIRHETEEETGYSIETPVKIFEAFMSPGSVTEKLHFFVAPYQAKNRVSAGGGLASEGEDIETFEVTIDEALIMLRDGRIVDAKTIMLVQYAALNLFKV